MPRRTCLPAMVVALILGSSMIGLSSAKEQSVTPDSQARIEARPGEPVVGVYYYPWYRKPGDSSKNQWRQAMRLRLKPAQEPLAGLYDSRDPAVIGEHIQQSVRGGIDFWAVSWWGPNSKTDIAFKDYLLKHPEANKLRYAVLYESTGRLGTFAKPDYRHWLKDLAYIQKTYFDHPQYLKVNRKPVVFVYLTREYFREKGHDVLREMRRQFPNLYLVGDDVYYSSEPDLEPYRAYQADWAKQFDAITAYDVYGQSVKGFGGTQKAIDYLAGNYRKAKKVANSVGTAFIPAIAPGYNDRAVREGNPGRARKFTDLENSQEGDVFRAMIRQVGLPNLDPTANNMMVITSFNEWYEDSQIEATSGKQPPSSTDDSESGTFFTGGESYVDYEYLYLDILKEEVEKGTRRGK